jgi:hypothetical protein
MRRSLVASFAILSTSAIYACAPANGADDDENGGEGSGATSGSSGNGTGGGAPTGGTTGGGTPTGGTGGGTPTGGAGGGTPTGGAGGGTPTGGAGGGTPTGGASGSAGVATGGAAGSGAGAGPVVCPNTDLSTLPIAADGWVARECNERGIQGPFYCYDDGIATSSCVDGMVPFRAGGGMCLSGDTIVDTTYAAWGAGIALGLNETGDMGGTTTSVKSAYNATMNGVTGFLVNITGDTGGLPLRIGFTGAAEQVGAAPFIQFPGAGTGTPYEVPIAQALVPETWTTDPNAGMAADPTNIFDMQVQVVGADVAAHYDFCIESVTPITDGSPPVGGTLMPYGQTQCGNNFATIALGSSYMVQNNAYGGATHCIQAAWDNGNKAGFTVSQVNANIATGGPPGSYPSVVYGWHVDGQMYGGYQSARQLSAITSAPSDWTFTVPASTGRYNASYDIWIHNSNARPGNTDGTLELMIWLYKRDTTPIGSMVGSVTLAGATWEVWYGTHDGFSTVSYIRVPSVTSVTGLDLKPFFSDAVTRGYAQASAYLLGIQAGFEIWEMNQNMVTNSFSVSVN